MSGLEGVDEKPYTPEARMRFEAFPFPLHFRGHAWLRNRTEIYPGTLEEKNLEWDENKTKREALVA